MIDRALIGEILTRGLGKRRSVQSMIWAGSAVSSPPSLRIAMTSVHSVAYAALHCEPVRRHLALGLSQVAGHSFMGIDLRRTAVMKEAMAALLLLGLVALGLALAFNVRAITSEST
ncbi:hypothetical protein [Krasilnikovia sp. MM14-A1259]|uniref:hypothetical protein n=1 Tax=Krasilnikovia sp. MM14-A1259 TaxID=3373539 RepID=UPI0038117A7E